MIKSTEIKNLSDEGLNFIINAEGLSLTVYRDSIGVFTIGVGSTFFENGRKVTANDPAITKERAISLFRNLLVHYEMGVYGRTRDDLNQNQFDALVSLTYNIGVTAFRNSNLLKMVNKNPNDPKIRLEFLKWTTAGGKNSKGLLSRRKREIDLYFK